MMTSPGAVLDELAAAAQAVRVMLVEDNPGDARLVSEMLHDAGDGAVLSICHRLADAEEPIARGLVDLVLLDLSLPDSQGLDGVRQLRATAPAVPVVVLSGLEDDQVALEAVQAGAQDFLIKGRVDGDGLSRAMRYAVERQRAERRLAQLALNDPLTGLPNRILFADRLEQALVRAARALRAEEPVRHVALMFIDLDGFKAVNDELGHLAGDQLLMEVAERLRDELRGADTVARLGGDEFTVLCENVIDEAAALDVAERLGRAIDAPYETDGQVAHVHAAIGVALARPGEEDGGALLRRADAAMYEAKRLGGGRVELSLA